MPGPINDIAQAFADEQAVARGASFELPHPLAGSVPMIASPMKFSATPVQYRRPPPLLGEHTDEVLREAGLAGEEIAALRAASVL